MAKKLSTTYSRAEAKKGDNKLDSVRWWRAKDEEHLLSQVWSWEERIRPALAPLIWADLIWHSLYTGRPMYGGMGQLPVMTYQRAAPAYLNVIRSLVDTAGARLEKRRPMPVISADDADYDEQEFAEETSRVLRRKMGSHDVEVLSSYVIRDMITVGDGMAMVVRNGGDVTVERVPMFEALYDPRSTYYNPPRTFGRVKPVEKDVLCARFPKYEDEIEIAPAFVKQYPWVQYAYGLPVFNDHAELGEFWRLPSIPGAKDGRHVIATRNCVLVDEPWCRPRLPLARCHWSNPMAGLRGQGLIEGLVGCQLKLNDALRDIQEALYHGAQLKVFAQRNTVNKHHLRARHPAVIEVDGPVPQYVPGNPVSESAINFVQLLIKWMYDLSGVNQAASSGKSTLGNDASGKALETMEDLQSDRHATPEKSYMFFRVQLGQLIVDEARAMYDEAINDDVSGGRNVQAELEKNDLATWITAHKWDDCAENIDGGNWELQIEPMNFVADSRGGKFNQVQEMVKAGLIPDPTLAADLFNEPDIRAANRTNLGPIKNIKRIIQGLKNPKIPMSDLAADNYMNVPLGILMVKGEHEMARALGTSDAVLERMQQWLESAKGVLDKTANAASLQGAQQNTQVAAPNASQLPGMGGAPAPGGPMPPGPPGGAPPMPLQ